MRQLGMIIDLAHASDSLVADVTRRGAPVLVSHTGVRGTCDRSRNLSDGELRAIAATGGLIGIGFWSGAVCGTTIDHVAKAIKHAVDVAGASHVALGSDFDGDAAIIDVAGLPSLASALTRIGLSSEDIELVFGKNVLAFLRNTLPE